jgi:hypothetical protein
VGASAPSRPTDVGLVRIQNADHRSLLCLAPRLRPLLTPPNDGTQKENRLDLRVALKKGAGQADILRVIENPNIDVLTTGARALQVSA